MFPFLHSWSQDKVVTCLLYCRRIQLDSAKICSSLSYMALPAFRRAWFVRLSKSIYAHMPDRRSYKLLQLILSRGGHRWPPSPSGSQDDINWSRAHGLAWKQLHGRLPTDPNRGWILWRGGSPRQSESAWGLPVIRLPLPYGKSGMLALLGALELKSAIRLPCSSLLLVSRAATPHTPTILIFNIKVIMLFFLNFVPSYSWIHSQS